MGVQGRSRSGPCSHSDDDTGAADVDTVGPACLSAARGRDRSFAGRRGPTGGALRAAPRAEPGATRPGAIPTPAALATATGASPRPAPARPGARARRPGPAGLRRPARSALGAAQATRTDAGRAFRGGRDTGVAELHGLEHGRPPTPCDILVEVEIRECHRAGIGFFFLVRSALLLPAGDLAHGAEAVVLVPVVIGAGSDHLRSQCLLRDRPHQARHRPALAHRLVERDRRRPPRR